MKRSFVQIDGVLYEKGTEPRDPVAPLIMPDIPEYTSMIDGTRITSRSRHREHLREHGMYEVGNDSSVKNPQYKGQRPPPGLKEKVIRAVNTVEDRQRRRR